MKSDPKNQQKMGQQDIVIIGGGIVGSATAALLAEAGRNVLVIDRTGICEETSSGNAAALAFSDILPMASKGVMRKVPGWLMDPLGPFSIRPSYFPKMVPWLYRFWRASSAGALEKTAVTQANIMRLAESEMLALIDRAGLRDRLREDGNLELYESEAELTAALPSWEIREKAGIAHEHVHGARLAELQPGLSPRIVAGTFVPGWKNVSDPKLFGQAIWAHAERLGARFSKAKVTSAQPADGGARVRLEDGTEISAKNLIVMTGAFSREFAKGFGDVVPLDTERGYNTTLPVGAFDVKRQLTFPSHGFVITPMATGLRVGGAVEFGGLDLPPNYARSKAMLTKASRFLPGLKTEGGREWMGYRPSIPDSLPVIGRASSGGNVFYGFGHGHLGLTQSAATARLIRDLITGAKPAIDIEPFKPQRFRN
ncbi:MULTISPECIES: FAD-dependent oxidoreductase [Brucella]|uniref:D-amino acid dehydrogenase small subunit n=1 Tax=Ochrobactrum soli TaxID=2448455 RepID=A0A2P9HQK5_9HYPH|nr:MULTISPECIES: FAD-dependent oxidoreductase [Brucella]RRD24281.1 FAD-dependent oxidoreductase [Brucellaceae bacterium VT-16-1752]WHT41755.1 FAD-dependent oxidoreductase [Ochrobactrum sp. SSR]MDX4076154.1 FAD-dependent oxidoreductase [Brucella sp. NBRC 113783]WHS31769.1 FAD-dependent oxidoreductase [Brucella sp. NM4]SPL66398.1 D-amino acid dehydrogenase small subunit [[Ochrobactrum] soli]